jgi:hypothetical protein
MVLTEQDDESHEGRRPFSPESMARIDPTSEEAGPVGDPLIRRGAGPASHPHDPVAVIEEELREIGAVLGP